MRWLIIINLIGCAAALTWFLRPKTPLFFAALLFVPLVPFAFAYITGETAIAAPRNEVILGLLLSAGSCYAATWIGCWAAFLVRKTYRTT